MESHKVIINNIMFLIFNYRLFLILITNKIIQVINRLKIVGMLLIDTPPPPVGLFTIVTNSVMLNK